MKKLCILLVFALLLSLGASAYAGSGVEIVVMDGIPVVMESLALTAGETNSFAADVGFTLPASLISIEEEAFAGTRAERVEISENVVSIGPRAFADSESLRELVIPGTVRSIDDTALAGCTNVAVYGESGSEAERFAEENGFLFFPANPAEEQVDAPANPVILPYVEMD